MPKRAISSVVGLGGFVSGIASMGNAQAVGYVVTRTHSYALIFAWASTMYLLSLLAIQILVPDVERAGRENSEADVSEGAPGVWPPPPTGGGKP